MLRTELQQLNWRKSTRSGDTGGNCVEAATVPAGTSWLKSSHSSDQGGNCVEVAYPTGGVAARDSKDPDGAVLVFDRPRWNGFLSTTRRGAFDRG